jgi:hypothetical protein
MVLTMTKFESTEKLLQLGSSIWEQKLVNGSSFPEGGAIFK